MNRRNLIRNLAIGGSSTALAPNWTTMNSEGQKKKPFIFCLNTSTIRGQKQGLVKDLETTSMAGYDGVEIWLNSLDEYLEGGGSLKDLNARIKDLGLTVEDAIGFAPWIVDDASVRGEAHEQLKKEMDMLAALGCRRIAAPPAGATKEAGLNLDAAAERFSAIVDLGKERGVIPQLEVWGFSKNLHKISQVLYVAAESGHSDARILPDIYHLYKGGSDFDALKLIKGSAIEIFHVNDYPTNPPMETIVDADRVYPGDGIAPVGEVLRDLYRPDGTTVLSLELFNPSYWEQDPLLVAKKGLAKMKAAVAAASV